MLNVEVRVENEGLMREFGVRLGIVLGAGDVLLLTGELGAGKTTLMQGGGGGVGGVGVGRESNVCVDS